MDYTHYHRIMNKSVVSIIINNYNYDRFIREAIDSALLQTYSPMEVIVVDDGSTDRSREIIAGYGEKIIPVLKQNGGQASAFNAGIRKSTGEVIIFLDSDDSLNSTAVENVIGHFGDKDIAKVHWPMAIMDEEGKYTGGVIPDEMLPEGNFKEHALQSGPPFFLNPPTSGNAWSRAFIESIMPVPENEFRIGADTFLFETVAFFGSVKRMTQPQGKYRIHKNNNYYHKTFADKLEAELRFSESLFIFLKTYCEKLGIAGSARVWKTHSWFHKVSQAIKLLKATVPVNSCIILVDEGKLGITKKLETFKIFHLMEIDGVYSGVPADSEAAIAAITTLHKKGAEYLVFIWSSYWWLEYFERMKKFLNEHFRCSFKNDNILIYNLRSVT